MKPELNLPTFIQPEKPPRRKTMDQYREFVMWCLKNTPIDLNRQRKARSENNPVVPFRIIS